MSEDGLNKSKIHGKGFTMEDPLDHSLPNVSSGMIRDLIGDYLWKDGQIREEVSFDEDGLLVGALPPESIIATTKLRTFSDLQKFMEKIDEASDFDAHIEFDPSTRVAVFSFRLKKLAPKPQTE